LEKSPVVLRRALVVGKARTPSEARVAAQEETVIAGSHSAQNPPDNQSAQEPTSSSTENKTDEKPIETDKDKEEKKNIAARL